MTYTIQESVRMLEMLPESEQERLEAAEQRIDSGDYVKDSEIEWN